MNKLFSLSLNWTGFGFNYTDTGILKFITVVVFLQLKME